MPGPMNPAQLKSAQHRKAGMEFAMGKSSTAIFYEQTKTFDPSPEQKPKKDNTLIEELTAAVAMVEELKDMSAERQNAYLRELIMNKELDAEIIKEAILDDPMLADAVLDEQLDEIDKLAKEKEEKDLDEDEKKETEHGNEQDNSKEKKQDNRQALNGGKVVASQTVTQINMGDKESKIEAKDATDLKNANAVQSRQTDITQNTQNRLDPNDTSEEIKAEQGQLAITKEEEKNDQDQDNFMRPGGP